jgi:methionyl-tRNA synthetase
MFMGVDIQAIHCIQWPADMIISQRNPDLGDETKALNAKLSL